MTRSTSEIIEQMNQERRRRTGLEPPLSERQYASRSEVIEQMRRDRRVQTGLEPLPPRAGQVAAPQVPAMALDPRLEGLLTDRRFTAVFDGMDTAELRSLLEE